jgi:hypothetical protein
MIALLLIPGGASIDDRAITLFLERHLVVQTPLRWRSKYIRGSPGWLCKAAGENRICVIFGAGLVFCDEQ